MTDGNSSLITRTCCNCGAVRHNLNHFGVTEEVYYYYIKILRFFRFILLVSVKSECEAWETSLPQELRGPSLLWLRRSNPPFPVDFASKLRLYSGSVH